MLLEAEIRLLPDWTFFVQLAIFLVVMVCLNGLVFQPVLRLLRLRKSRTEGDRKRIEELKEKTQDLMKEYAQKIQEAKREAFIMKEALRKEGNEQGQKIIQEAKQAGLTQIEKAKTEIEGLAKTCTEQLETHADVLSRQIAEKVLGRSLNH